LLAFSTFGNPPGERACHYHQVERALKS